MAELVKPWDDGGSLSVTYDGSGDGSAVFSSDAYEGIDRKMSVSFKGGDVVVERIVRQEGVRQPIGLKGGGIFRLANGGRFGVLRDAKPYTELDYIQSTGKQYINTLYMPNTNTEIEVKASGISVDSFALSSSGTWFFGGRQGYLNNAFGSYYNQSTQALYYAFGKNMPYAKYTDMYGDNKVLKANSSGMYVNGTKVMSMTSNNFTSSCPLTLFALNNNGSVISFTSYKIHYCKIWDNGELVRDLIPVVDKDGIACMYDKESGEFFYNQGTGEFITGDKI